MKCLYFLSSLLIWPIVFLKPTLSNPRNITVGTRTFQIGFGTNHNANVDRSETTEETQEVMFPGFILGDFDLDVDCDGE